MEMGFAVVCVYLDKYFENLKGFFNTIDFFKGKPFVQERNGASLV